MIHRTDDLRSCFLHTRQCGHARTCMKIDREIGFVASLALAGANALSREKEKDQPASSSRRLWQKGLTLRIEVHTVLAAHPPHPLPCPSNTQYRVSFRRTDPGTLVWLASISGHSQNPSIGRPEVRML